MSPVLVPPFGRPDAQIWIRWGPQITFWCECCGDPIWHTPGFISNDAQCSDFLRFCRKVRIAQLSIRSIAHFRQVVRSMQFEENIWSACHHGYYQVHAGMLATVWSCRHVTKYLIVGTLKKSTIRIRVCNDSKLLMNNWLFLAFQMFDISTLFGWSFYNFFLTSLLILFL